MFCYVILEKKFAFALCNLLALVIKLMLYNCILPSLHDAVGNAPGPLKYQFKPSLIIIIIIIIIILL